MRRPQIELALVVLIALAAACGSGAALQDSESTSTPSATPEPIDPTAHVVQLDLQRMVLAQQDYGEIAAAFGVVPADSGVVSNADVVDDFAALPVTEAEVATLGRLTGYELSFVDTEDTIGPFIVTSSVELFTTAKAASAFLDLYLDDSRAAIGTTDDDGVSYLAAPEFALQGVGDRSGGLRLEAQFAESPEPFTYTIGYFQYGRLVGVTGIGAWDRANRSLAVTELTVLLGERVRAVVEGGDAARSPEPAFTPVANAAEVPACEGGGRRVCLVPLADFASPSVDSLVQHLVALGIPAGALPAVELELADIDRARVQLSANKAAARVDAAYPKLTSDPQVTVIAFTDLDMFIEEQTFNWVFGMRGPGSQVISTARMHEEIWGGERDDAVRDSRLRKMLLRYVGLFHLGLPENASPLTVLYEHLDGLTQLDAMREGVLEPSQLPRPTGAVGVWANAFCSAAEHLAVRDYRADVDVGRSFAIDLPANEARPAVLAYLTALTDARVSFLAELEDAAPLAAANLAGSVGAFHAQVQASLQSSLDHLAAASADVGGLQTTAEITARVVEVAVAEWTAPESTALYDAYGALPLEALVALVDAGPCGGFTPVQFYEAPTV